MPEQLVSERDATTDALAYARDAQHTVEILAIELERLAERLRRLSPGFANERISAVERAADIVNSYVQHTGQGGCRLQSIVSVSARIDRAREIEVRE